MEKPSDEWLSSSADKNRQTQTQTKLFKTASVPNKILLRQLYTSVANSQRGKTQQVI